MESCDLKLIGDGRAWKVDGRAKALVGPCLATSLLFSIHTYIHTLPYHTLTKESFGSMIIIHTLLECFIHTRIENLNGE